MQLDGANPAPPLVSHVDALVRVLDTQVASLPEAWEPGAIHQARVATRRLGAALKLLKPILGKKTRRKLTRVLRRLRRRLGPLRDADVMLGHLADLAEAPRQRRAAEWLAARIRGERDALRDEWQSGAARPAAGPEAGAWQAVRERMTAFGSALAPLLADSLRAQLDGFAAAAGSVTGADRTAHDPHELRIHGKALRYTLEMAAAEGLPIGPDVLATFKRMQDDLGAWHDFVVLTEKLLGTSLETRLAHHDPALHDEVLRLARTTLRQSARQLRRFGKRWNAEGGNLLAKIREALTPCAAAGSAPVTESRTGPGPSDSAGTSDPGASPPVEPSAAS